MSAQNPARTQYATTSSGTRIAYRVFGGPLHRPTGPPPLFMHMHYRGNMDFWDPLLLRTLSASRPVVVWDSPGIGRSRIPSASAAENAATIPPTFQGWADALLSLVDALGFTQIDLLGFSMGGAAAQMAALSRPALVRKLVLAGTTASAPPASEDGAGIVWPREHPSREPFLALARAGPERETEAAIRAPFFPRTAAGVAACAAYFARLRSRTDTGEPVDLDLLDKMASKRQGAAFEHWSVPNSANSFERLGELRMPVLVLNGDEDLLIPTSRSWELAKRIEGAKLVVYPRAGHGFIWQCAGEVGREVCAFLDGDGGGDGDDDGGRGRGKGVARL